MSLKEIRRSEIHHVKEFIELHAYFFHLTFVDIEARLELTKKQ